MVVIKVVFSHAPIAVSCFEKRIYHLVSIFWDCRLEGVWQPVAQRANLKVSQNVGFYATIRLALSYPEYGSAESSVLNHRRLAPNNFWDYHAISVADMLKKGNFFDKTRLLVRRSKYLGANYVSVRDALEKIAVSDNSLDTGVVTGGGL